jgi:7-cyano-7-deazaguanine synthase
MIMSKALVVLSGGQDSTTCLFWARDHYASVEAITFDYGQRHYRELEAARIVAAMADVPQHTLEVGPILRGASPLVNPSSKLEQYADAASLPGGLEKTFVPGRNALFLVLAANYAYTIGALDIVTGVSAEDYGGYPDCRPEFINEMEAALRLGLSADENDPWHLLAIQVPLMYLSKKRTVQLAKELPGCWEALAYTHTAYDGAYPPVGHDHATLLRAKGFEEAGYPDPLVLRAVREGLMPIPTTENYHGL